MSTNDPLAPIINAENDLTVSIGNATGAISNCVREILQAVKQLKAPGTPTGEIGGLATQIENQAKAVQNLADQLNASTKNLTTAAGPAPTSISSTPAAVTLDSVTAPTVQLQILDSDQDDVTSEPTTEYTSDNPAVATVNTAGLVTFVSAGTANINVVDEFGNSVSVPVTATDSSATGGGAPAANAAKKSGK